MAKFDLATEIERAVRCADNVKQANASLENSKEILKSLLEEFLVRSVLDKSSAMEVASQIYWSRRELNELVCASWSKAYSEGFLAVATNRIVFCVVCDTTVEISVRSWLELDGIDNGEFLCDQCKLGYEEATELNIAALRSMPYSEYLKSGHWKRTRTKALRWAEGKCHVCNSTHRLEVHHKTYVRRGYEAPEDLLVLCNSCHGKYHGILPKGGGN